MKYLIYIFLPLCLSFGLFSQTYQGTVIYVKDGDTFVFQTQTGSLTVRMQGIDAPEKDQPYGQQSKAFLMQYKDKAATLKTYGVDRYGRTLGTLFVNSENINYLSVLNGCAWHYKRYSTDQQLAQAEVTARAEKKGLWALENPIAPWEWRHNK